MAALAAADPRWRPPPGGPSPFDTTAAAVAAAVAPPASAPAKETVDNGIHNSKTRYFVITSNNKENVVKSVRHGLWATQRKNEEKLDDAFRTAPAVLLVFSVNRSENFQGYARMRSPIGRPRSSRTDPFNGFGRLFDVEWLRLHDLHYREVEHLRNSLNGDRPVPSSRDGQELSNSAGQSLCGLIDRHIDSPEDFLPPPSFDPFRPQHDLSQPGFGGAAKRGRSRSGSPTRREGGSSAAEPPRKSRRSHLDAPNPTTASFDEQLAFFLDLDYDEYVKWWQRNGSASPGPTSPPNLAPPPSSLLAAAAAPPPHFGGCYPPPSHVGAGGGPPPAPPGPMHPSAWGHHGPPVHSSVPPWHHPPVAPPHHMMGYHPSMAPPMMAGAPPPHLMGPPCGYWSR